MRISSFLVQGRGSALADHIHSVTSVAVKALVLYSLGADHTALLNTIKNNGIRCPVYLTETYGIIGHDVASGKNIELMEKGRGSEYGFRGGSGGRGCLVVAYDGDDVTSGTTADFPAGVENLLVVADTSGSFGKVADDAPLHYGGITKECFVALSPGGDDVVVPRRVPYFWVGSRTPVGISAFGDDAGVAAESLLGKIPDKVRASGDVGLFPCFSRGVNQYGVENVESDAIGGVMKKPRVYGMFAHGELGPVSFAGFSNESTSQTKIDFTQHSGMSILAIHTESDSLGGDL
mmetsp:Transcript_7408/g.9171  ORF Transcript_7408/g.9171 Transcript_7408/m.9171 type:complete len:291 (+) Transcript_7408:42-914(+)